MPTVILAGHNLDAESMDALRRGEPAPVTPETLSAAYARISRDPRPVPELRAAARADVARARASNDRIVFGFGHHSVAEHAVFNFDVLDASRLAIEALEAHRLASYTEKSQRYVRLGEDFVVPAEAAHVEAELRAFLKRSFARYAALNEGLVAAGVPERLAGEDARYALPLATTGQLGMTVNARELERMVLNLSASPLAEVRDLASQLHARAAAVAPSLLRHVTPGPYDLARHAEVAAVAGDIFPEASGLGADPAQGRPSWVGLVRATPDGDGAILAALTQPSLGTDHATVLDLVRGLDRQARARLFEAATRLLGPHDVLPRELEHASLCFDVVLSAAAFGQLKRHRMASLTAAPYRPDLGAAVPPAISGAGLAPLLEDAAEDARGVAAAIGGPAAAYALLNAHRRRVLLTVNLRELYHLSRLREDAHAQWDIRAIAVAMSEAARAAFPVCASRLGGKDTFGS